ncbi:patatin-like phospholipase family protein [Inhella sp. 4Y17]|uniref:Patatin-like phospholipase family protein n=1 Tax=Inhella gelatinilytica TaxID=2795030 RepID=A0A931NC65_9BURK|nr:patatin-like phospholipase family protein [Inhella gelatinilytica]
MRGHWARALLGAFVLATSGSALAAEAPANRPKVGLVLSGGGARGLTHIGVLKVLERERIPVDVIAGTSMGAIIGGLYASGMSASALERELKALDWEQVFANRVDRQHLSQRRKEEDYAFSAALELGLREGELRAPQGTVSSRGLEVLLRRLTLPTRDLPSFDALPIPFRAVATDMESGEALVMDQGDLATALRASMSVPGVFSPIERNDRLLGDGGLVNNLPVDVARRLGAERVIAVNVGTPLSGREALGSLLGLTTQMINILTEQNVKRSLASLWDEDVLINPGLGSLTAADFERASEFIRIGEASAEALVAELRPLSLSAAQYARWRTERQLQGEPAPPVLAALRMDGSQSTRPERWLAVLDSKPGDPFDVRKAVRDTRLLAASGDYARVDFHLEASPAGEVLVFDLEDKPWGPNYLKLGLDLSTDDRGLGSFNLRLSHNRHWLNSLGGEWRNQLTIGRAPRLFSEWYQPLAAQAGTRSDWFVSAWGEAQLKRTALFDTAGQTTALLRRRTLTAALDLGQPWGRLGEFRLGLWQEAARWHSDINTVPLPLDRLNQVQRLFGLRAQVQVDQLDEVNFPRSGWRTVVTGIHGRQTGLDGRAYRLEAEGLRVLSWGDTTLNLYGKLARTQVLPDVPGGPYALGGFQQLSGMQADQITGNALALFRAGVYHRLLDAPVLSRGLFLGGSLEAGNVWIQPRAARWSALRWAGSVYVGADTAIGPLYLALGRTDTGSNAVYLFLGRP